MPFEELERTCGQADIVISSTGAALRRHPREDIGEALKQRRHRPMFFIDIAVPRDIDPRVNRVDNAYLYDIDDLQHVVEENRDEREKEAHNAERIVTRSSTR